MASGRLRSCASTVALLSLCAVGYFGFHAVRRSLPAGFVHDSFPSLLVPGVLFGVVDLLPRVRFRSARDKYSIEFATLIASIAWLEALAPRLTSRAVGDVRDAIAMLVGFAAFVLYDFAFGPSSSAEPLDRRRDDCDGLVDVVVGRLETHAEANRR